MLIFMECWHPNQKLVVECCFLDLLWWCDEDEARLLNGGRMSLVRGRNKYLMMTKTKHSGFFIQIHFNFVLWF